MSSFNRDHKRITSEPFKVSVLFRPGLYYRYTVIGFAILVAGSLISPCLAAPTPSDQNWWVNSCNPIPPTHTRHGRSADENQLKIFISKVNSFIRDLSKNYPKVPNFKLRLHWLNIKKIQRTMEAANNTYQGFHKALQVFAIYMEKLKTVNISTNAKFAKKKYRDHIYINATKNLKLVICEYEELLHKEKLEISVVNEKKLKMRFPKPTMDLSEVLITDLQFFTKMKKFLKRSRRILKKFKKSTRPRNKKKVH